MLFTWSLYLCRRRPTLPHTFACSTIGPAGLNFRVRDGNGCFPRGKITGFVDVDALASFGPSASFHAGPGYVDSVKNFLAARQNRRSLASLGMTIQVVRSVLTDNRELTTDNGG